MCYAGVKSCHYPEMEENLFTSFVLPMHNTNLNTGSITEKVRTSVLALFSSVMNTIWRIMAKRCLLRFQVCVILFLQGKLIGEVASSMRVNKSLKLLHKLLKTSRLSMVYSATDNCSFRMLLQRNQCYYAE